MVEEFLIALARVRSCGRRLDNPGLSSNRVASTELEQGSPPAYPPLLLTSHRAHHPDRPHCHHHYPFRRCRHPLRYPHRPQPRCLQVLVPCIRGVVEISKITICCLLRGVELAKDALGHEVEDMGEASGLVGSAGEIFDEGRKVFDHSVIVGRVIAGNAEDLR